MDKSNPADSKLEAQISLILMKAGVTGPEIDECIMWAFGKDAWYVPPCEWVGRWNKLHPTDFKVKKSDRVVEFVFVVGKFFVAQKYKGIIIPGAN